MLGRGHGELEERDAFRPKTGLLTEKPWLRGGAEKSEPRRVGPRLARASLSARRSARRRRGGGARPGEGKNVLRKAALGEPRVGVQRPRRRLRHGRRARAFHVGARRAKAVASSSAGKMVGGVDAARARAARARRASRCAAIRRCSFPATGSRETKASNCGLASPKRRTPCGGAVTNSTNSSGHEGRAGPPTTSRRPPRRCVARIAGGAGGASERETRAALRREADEPERTAGAGGAFP